MDKARTGLIHARSSQLPIVFRLLDTVLIGAVLWLCMALHQVPWRVDYQLAALMAMCLFLVSGQLWDMYRPSAEVRLLDKHRHSLVFGWLSVVSVLLLIGYGFGAASRYAVPVMIAWFVATPVVLSAWRAGLKLALRLLRHRGYSTQRVAIAGAGPLGQSLAQEIKDSPWDGLSLLGLFDERQPAGGPVGGNTAIRGDIPFRGDFDELLELSERGAVDRVYIALPMQAEARIRDLTEKLANLPVAVHMVLDSFAFGLLRGSLHSLGDISTLSIFDTPLNGPGAGLKRVADLVLSAIILCLAAVPMAAIAAGVRFSSPGPVIFKQRRSGLDGRQVVVWKFRTMTVTEDGADIVQARTSGDPRVTPFGAFLRRTFLDELPQFINVLQGHLSIVGPRPHAIAHNEKYRRLIPFYMLRHRVKPGITGWAQVNGFRGETELLSKMEGRVERDLWYIRNWTPWLDLKIILSTAVQVLQNLLPRGHWVSWTRSGTAGPTVAPSVLLLVENLPVPLDRRVWLEAQSLRARGYRVSVVCPRMYGHTAAYEQRDGVHIYRFPLWFEASGLIGYVLEYGSALAFMLCYALRVWMKTGVDVIHVANPPDLLAFVALPFKLCGKKVIYDQHDLCPELFAAKGQGGPRLHRLLLALERISYRLADAVVVPNHSYRDIALGRGKKAESDVFVVRNGPLRDALAPKPSGPLKPLIGYVGVMGDQDGVDLLLEVAAKLKDRYPELRWVLLGDGTHRPYCEAYAKELGVDDRVTFTGMVDEKRIAAELAPCRVCVVPDRVNDFTARSTMNKVMEYMALEKPSVQFDTPEGRYSARSASLYADPNDADDFADKVAELLDDPARARKMGALGRARFLHSLHWAESVKVLYRAYDHVLKPEKSVQLVSLPRSVGEFSEEQCREQRPVQEFDLVGTAPREAAEAQGAVRRTTGPAVLRIGTELAAASE